MASPLGTVLAQEVEPTDPVGEQVGEQVETLIDLFPQMPAWLEFFLARIITPALAVLVIIVLAALLSRFAKRGIRRTAERMKQPDPRRTWRGLVGPEPVTPERTEAVGRIEHQRRVQRAEALCGLATSVVTSVIWVMAVIMALGQINIQLGPLIAGAGIVGVAIGFGAQDLVKDFLSGVFMLIEDQYGVGDIIDVGEADGVVEEVSLRSTSLRDINGTLWHVPNGEIRRVGNMSQGWARALLDVEVAYGADIDAVSELIARVAVEMANEEKYRDLFLDEPSIWGVQELGADGIAIRLVIKVVPGEQWAIMRELRRRIKNAFDEAGVEIPFPQRTVWLRTEQPVALGDADAPPFRSEAPDETVLRRAVGTSKQGVTGRLQGDFDELLPRQPTDDDDLRTTSGA